ncbi:unnamed protein product [Rotaria sp. Silwood1]|nr:unnamed protein product [Rotaria sp. Silwood1]
MLTRRHELWVCVNDHCQNGSLSYTALSGVPRSQLADRQPINDEQIQYLIPRQQYSHDTILNVSREYFPSVPMFGKIRWILYDGNKCAFVYKIFKVKDYV